MKLTITILSVVLVLLIGCAREVIEEPTVKEKDDSMYACNAFKIYHDDFYSLDSTDLYQFLYSGTDEIRFIRNGTDTFIFTGTGKFKGMQKYHISPCQYYFNYWDTSVITFISDSWPYPLIINQQVVPKGDGIFLPYYGYFELNSPSLHTFSISFNKLSFASTSKKISAGQWLEVPSNTLLTYKVYLRPGGIDRFVIQGGEKWVAIP